MAAILKRYALPDSINGAIFVRHFQRKSGFLRLDPAFDILVVRALGTAKKVAGQLKILTQLSDGQSQILTPQL